MVREHDIVVLGATGFTGALTAAEIAVRAPADARIALAGRSRERLERVRERLSSDVPRLADAELVVANTSSYAQMRELAASTRVLTTTVGPYVLYGTEVTAACAAEGTAYADLTGEPEFVDRTYLDHHEAATVSGARLVHCCGFDSVPHDLGVQFTAEQFSGDAPLRVRGYAHWIGGRFSGGTLHSALTGFSRAHQTIQAARRRAAIESAVADMAGRRSRSELGHPHRALGYWAVPLPTIDPAVVARSGRALPEYGPDFSYSHYMAVRRLPVAFAIPAVVAGVAVGSQLPPLRHALGRIAEPGTGPSEQTMSSARFWVRFVGESDGRRVLTEVSGGEPGYRETSRMLAEASLSLAFDELPDIAGQLTTAQAMGPLLRQRLEQVGGGADGRPSTGLTFKLLEQS